MGVNHRRYGTESSSTAKSSWSQDGLQGPLTSFLIATLSAITTRAGAGRRALCMEVALLRGTHATTAPDASVCTRSRETGAAEGRSPPIQNLRGRIPTVTRAAYVDPMAAGRVI
jgi:hypothetical protein